MNRFLIATGVLLCLYLVALGVCAGLRSRKAKCMCNSWSESQRLLADAPVSIQVSCGTLLGTIRESGVITNDDDIDLMVLDSDWDAAVKHFQDNYDQKNFKLRFRDSGNTLTLYPKSCKPIGGIDLYKMVTDPVSGRYNLFGVELEPEAVTPGKVLEMAGPKSKKHSVAGLVRVPTNPESFLEAMYGPEWRTPLYLSKGNTAWRPIDILHTARRGAAKIGLYV